jgi:NAD(P)-dependent dehydrogenase (short-subunit alcohol dehydrogenase family)
VNGRTVVVTGANTGIGLETAAGLAEKGARVVLTARDPAKGTAAVELIRSRNTAADVTLMQLDLARLSDVRTFADDFLARFDHLHVLVNNAGLVLDKRTLTEDGFETMFQVNHLGPFLLTNLLLDRMKASAPARIVNVASVAHRGNTLDFEDIQKEKGFRGLRGYGQTKLCNILFTRELARRLEGRGVTANALHPGTVRTGFGREGDTRWIFALGIKLAAPFFLSAARGARTSIYLASSPEVDGKTGGYWARCRPATPSEAATDDEAARRLWELSADFVGL